MGEQRAAKWYFGGMASCGAACFTHPLDLLKVCCSLCIYLKMNIEHLRVSTYKPFTANLHGSFEAEVVLQGLSSWSMIINITITFFVSDNLFIPFHFCSYKHRYIVCSTE